MKTLHVGPKSWAIIELGVVLCPGCKKGHPKTGNVTHGVFDCPSGCGYYRLQSSKRQENYAYAGKRHRRYGNGR